jgi:D-arabinose 1-dehydrogenase-like Zn-dependent alcohol dehydrogenase
MKAVRYELPGNFAVTDVPMPAVGPLDVRIKIHQSGVCGTDLHLHHGTFIGTYPLIPGHETIGEIDEVGSDVSRFGPGDRVTVNPNIYCGQCAYCLAGQLVRCVDLEGWAFTGQDSSPSTSALITGKSSQLTASRKTPQYLLNPPPAPCTGWRLLIFAQVVVRW